MKVVEKNNEHETNEKQSSIISEGDPEVIASGTT